jgi:hypothetical protein
MSRDDEKDIIGQSASNPDQYARADHGRLDKLRDAVRQTKGKEITTHQAAQRLNQLKNNMAGEEEQETKRTQRAQRDQDAKNVMHSATKTRKEEEEEAVLGAQSKSTPERVIDQNDRKEEAQKELEQTDQMADMG